MRISIDGQYLILPEDTKVSFDRDSSAFSYDVIKDSISIGLSISGPENATLIQNAHRIGVANRMSIYACQVEDMGIVIADARILIEQGDVIGPRAVISFSLIVTGFGASLLDSKLSDFDLGTIDIGPHGSQTSWAEILSLEAEGRVRFPTYFNAAHFDGKNPEWGELHDDGLAFVNRFEGGSYRFNVDALLTDERRSSDALSPWPVLHYVLKTILTQIGYHMTGSFWQLPESKDILLQSDRTLDLLNTYKGFKVSESSEVDVISTDILQFLTFDAEIHDDHDVFNLAADTWQFEVDDYADYIITGEYFYEIDETAGSVTDVELSFLVKYPLSGTIDPGVTLHQITTPTPLVGQWVPFYAPGNHVVAPGDVGTDFHFSRRVDWTGLGTVNGFKVRNLTAHMCLEAYSNINTYEKEIIINQHVPQVTVKDLLLDLRKMGIDIWPDPFGKEIHFDLVTDIMNMENSKALQGASDEYSIELQTTRYFTLQSKLSSESKDEVPIKEYFSTSLISEFPIITMKGIYVLETLTGKIYRSTGDTVLDPSADPYEFLFYYLPYHTIGTAGEGTEEELTPDTELLPMEFYDMNEMTGASDTIHLWFIPVMNEVGSSPAFKNGIKKHSTLRMAIWRGFYDDGHRTYPFATSFNKDRNGTLLGDLSLDMADAVYGISRFQNPLLEALVKEERITVPCRLTPTQVKNMSLTHPWIHNAKRLAIRSLPVTLDGKAEHIHDIEFTLI